MAKTTTTPKPRAAVKPPPKIKPKAATRVIVAPVAKSKPKKAPRPEFTLPRSRVRLSARKPVDATKRHAKFIARLGREIEKARVALGITQASFAEATSGAIHPRMLANYESNTEPKLSTFLVICATLGRSPLDVLPADIREAVVACDVQKLVKIFAD